MTRIVVAKWCCVCFLKKISVAHGVQGILPGILNMSVQVLLQCYNNACHFFLFLLPQPGPSKKIIFNLPSTESTADCRLLLLKTEFLYVSQHHFGTYSDPAD